MKLELIRLFNKIGVLFASCDGKYTSCEQEFIEGILAGIKKNSIISDEEYANLLREDIHVTFESVLYDYKEFMKNCSNEQKRLVNENIISFIEGVINADGVSMQEETKLLERWKASAMPEDFAYTSKSQEEIIKAFQSIKKPEFEERTFWQKLGEFAKKAGLKVIYAALLLYYVMVAKSTSAKDKALIAGALAYLVSPIDIIPDGIPVVGFADDLVVLLYVLKTVRENVTDEIKAQAKTKLSDWFKTIDEKELAEVL